VQQQPAADQVDPARDALAEFVHQLQHARFEGRIPVPARPLETVADVADGLLQVQRLQLPCGNQALVHLLEFPPTQQISE
jgi:hypothetical protein